MSDEQTAVPEVPPEALMPPMPRKPADVMDPVDAMKMENSALKGEVFKLREENARLLGELLGLRDRQTMLELRAKYQLGPKDRIDPQSLRIVRGQ